MSDASSTFARSSQAPAAVKPRRQWYQFTLKSLLFWFLFFGLVLGVLGRWIHRAREQAARVTTLRGFGVEVFYSGQISTDEYGRVWHHGDSRKSFAERELEPWLGIDCIRSVRGLQTNAPLHTISGERDEFWRLAALFPELNTLEVSNAWCDSAGLARLRGKSSLRALIIRNAKVTNEDLEVIGTLTGLQNLSLDYVPSDASILDDRGIAHLSALNDLRYLQLDIVGMTDASLPRLAAFPRLKALSLSKASVTDRGARFLANLTDLEVLELRNTRISDRGLAALSELAHLKYLGLSGTEITDEGLQHLRTLVDLETLEVSDTEVHGPGLAALASLPKLTRVRFRKNPVKDEDLHYFADLPELESLDLEQTLVTDVGIKTLRLGPKVIVITIFGTSVTDEGLISLGRYRQLQVVRVEQSRVTPEVEAMLKRQSPSCQIGPFSPTFKASPTKPLE
jgi:hypothetical protein